MSWVVARGDDGVVSQASLLAVPLVAVVVLMCAVWVLGDARSREEDGRPVVATVMNATIDQPALWAALCIVLFVVALPLYLVARRADV